MISSAIGLYAVIGGILSPWTRAQQPINDAGAQIRIFESVLQHIQNDYVDEPNLEKVRFGALRGLVGGLDPYSSYLTPQQVADFNAAKNAKKIGIGAEFSQVSLYLYVVSVMKDSEADRAGLKAGDVIEYIENKATRDISLYDAKQMIYGQPGTTVNLRVLRAGSKPLQIKVTRGDYKIPAPESRVEAGKTGVIKIFDLETGQANQVRTQVENLKKQGIQKIVLDLRGLATGSIDEAVQVANLFIGSGDLAKIIGKDNQVSKTFTANPAKAIFDGKVAAVIDLGTAGPGEVIAAAMLDRKRGEVVGERSFGAGTEQQLFTLRAGDGLLLTTAKWASPNGVPFLGDSRDNTGLKPSVEVKRPDTPEPVEVEDLIDDNEDKKQNPQATPTPNVEVKKAVDDVQLKKAIEILQDKPEAAKAAGAQ